MPEFTSYRPGTACWVDLSSTDVKESVEFYGQLFGWRAEFDDRPETGGYGTFRRHGMAVAGLGPTMAEGQSPTWNTYFSTDDVAKTVMTVREAGGTVVVEPMEIMEEGTLAVFQDPTGAYFSAWQPGRQAGARLAGEPGTLNWVELATRDAATAKEFYHQVFGWAADDKEMGGMPYTTFMLAGDPVAGMIPMGEQFPAETPPHWLVYLGTADVDAATAMARGLGARELYGPQDIPDMGRFAVLADPKGAIFALWEQVRQG